MTRNKPKSVWDMTWKEACKARVRRKSPGSTKLETLDPGVRWFVLALEALGVSTAFSCDGHGCLGDWYLTFHAPYPIALEIARCDDRFKVSVIETSTVQNPYWRLAVAGHVLRKPEGENAVTWTEYYQMCGLDLWLVLQHQAAEAWKILQPLAAIRRRPG